MPDYVVERRVTRPEQVYAATIEDAARLAKIGTGTDETLLSVMTHADWVNRERTKAKGGLTNAG